MRLFKKGILGLFIIAQIFIFISPVQANSETPSYGGVLKTVIPTDPPTLDVHWSGSDLIWTIAWHMFEPILTFDKNWNPIPMLADYELSADGKVISLNLRKDVKFHNGKTMTADDVVASLKRWLKLSGQDKGTFKNLKNIKIVNPNKVLIELSEPSALAITILAFHDQGPFIMPKEVIEAAGDGELKEYIGTGPYQFVEWKPDRHIKMRRFKEYSKLPGGANGLGGTKHAYVDEILFIPVGDSTTKVNGLITGDFDISNIKQTDVDTIKENPSTYAAIQQYGEMPCMVFNMKQGIMANIKMRQAVLAALNMDDIMLASENDPSSYDIHPGWMPRGKLYWNDEGSNVYNRPNPERAKKLLKEAGYQGEEIIWVTTTAYSYMKDAAIVAKAQLKKVGLNIKLQMVDWATLSEIRYNPGEYNIFSTGLTMKVDPTMIAFMRDGWAGWYDTPRKHELVDMLKSTFDLKKRQKLWTEMSKVIWEELPAIKFGEKNFALGMRNKVQGQDLGPATFYWNTWMKR